MSIFREIVDKALDRFGYSKKGFDAFSGASAETNNVSAKNAIKVFDGWVYACIRAIAEDVGNIDFELFRAKNDGDLEQIYNADVLDLLSRPNPYMSGRDFMYMITAHKELVGNAYLLLDGVASEKTKPKAIYLLSPDRVKIVRKTNDPRQPVEYYEYEHGTYKARYQPHEIIHLKYPNPENPYVGLGTVQAIAQWIDAENYAQEFNRRFFLQGAKLSGLITSDKNLTDDQLRLLKESFQQVYSGVKNSHKVAMLPTGAEFKEVGTTQKDMDFIEGQRLMRDKILAGFKVPLTALGITEDVNRANAEATNYVFALRTIRPKMQMLVQELQDQLVSRYSNQNQRLVLGFKDPVPENREAKIEEMKAATNSAAVMSVNEAREWFFGLVPVKNGDAVMTDFNKIPLGSPVEQTKAIKTSTKTLSTQKSHADIQEEKHSNFVETLKQNALDVYKAIKNNIEERLANITEMDDDTYEKQAWSPFVSRVSRYEGLFKRNLEKINEDQAEVIIENVETFFKTKDLPNDIDADKVSELMDEERFVKATIDLETPLMLELYKEEAAAAGALIGLEFENYLTEEIKDAIVRSVELMANSYSDTTREKLIETLKEAQLEGDSFVDLKDKILAIKDFNNVVRAEMVARTETFRVANRATREAWKTSGVVKTIKWFTASDERVCQYCAPLHNKVVDIDEAFFAKGDTHVGAEGGVLNLDYDDVDNPPIHPRCRCYIKPDEISIE